VRRGLGVKEVVAHTGAQYATTRLGKIWFIHGCVKIVPSPPFSPLLLPCLVGQWRPGKGRPTRGRMSPRVEVSCCWCVWVAVVRCVVYGVGQEGCENKSRTGSPWAAVKTSCRCTPDINQSDGTEGVMIRATPPEKTKGWVVPSPRASTNKKQQEAHTRHYKKEHLMPKA